MSVVPWERKWDDLCRPHSLVLLRLLGQPLGRPGTTGTTPDESHWIAVCLGSVLLRRASGGALQGAAPAVWVALRKTRAGGMVARPLDAALPVHASPEVWECPGLV